MEQLELLSEAALPYLAIVATIVVYIALSQLKKQVSRMECLKLTRRDGNADADVKAAQKYYDFIRSNK